MNTADRIRRRLVEQFIEYDGDVDDLVRRADAGQPVIIKGPAAIVWQIREIVNEERKAA
jgi:hypothetical protein